MLLDKHEFLKRLELASEIAKNISRKYMIETPPDNNVYTLKLYNDRSGKQDPQGRLKYLGGRFLKPADLYKVSSRRAAQILWIDGKVPAWIHLNPLAVDEESTNIYISFTPSIVIAEESNLIQMREQATKPFSPRSPFLPGPWKMEDGPISINNYGKRRELNYQLEEIKIECSIDNIDIPAEIIDTSIENSVGEHNYTCILQGKNADRLFDFLSTGKKKFVTTKEKEGIFSNIGTLYHYYYVGQKQYKLLTINTYEFDKISLRFSGTCSEIKG